MVIQTNSSVWLVFRGTEWPSIDPIDIKQDEKVGRAAAVQGATWTNRGMPCATPGLGTAARARPALC